MSLTYTLCNVVIHLCVVRTPSRCEEITFREYWLKRLVENGSLEIFLRPGIVSIVFSGVIDPFTFCENVSGKIHHTLGGRPLEGCKRSPSLDSQSATHRVRVGRAGEREKRSPVAGTRPRDRSHMFKFAQLSRRQVSTLYFYG